MKKRWVNDCYQGGDNDRLLLYGRGGYPILGQKESDVKNSGGSHDEKEEYENEIVMKKGENPAFLQRGYVQRRMYS